MAEAQEGVTYPRFTKFRRTNVAEMRPYLPGEILPPSVSVSEPDREAGSPKPGDMIARNPENHGDQWLVAEAYFRANFAPLTDGAVATQVVGRQGAPLPAFPIQAPYPDDRRKLALQLGCPASVPWSVVEPARQQALANHGQTLERLAERGGLSPGELACLLDGKHWSENPSTEDAVASIIRHLALAKDSEVLDRWARSLGWEPPYDVEELERATASKIRKLNETSASYRAMESRFTTELRAMRRKIRSTRDDQWIWTGHEEEDDLPSLCDDVPVVILAGELRALLESTQKPAGSEGDG